MSELRKQMRQDMFNSMREVLGAHYVKDYYLQNMADFVSIADWYAKESIEEEKQALKQRLIDAVNEKSKSVTPDIADVESYRWAMEDAVELIEKVFSES